MMPHLPQRKLAALLFLLAFLTCAGIRSAHAAAPSWQSSDITLTVTAGFDGQYKRGNWVPVYITIANSGNALDGTLRIVTGNATLETDIRYDSPVSLPTQSNKRLVTYIYLPDLIDAVTVTLLDGQQEVAQANSNRLQSLEQDMLLYGVVSPLPDELGFLETVTGARTQAAVAVLKLEDLPEAPAAWAALDVLVLNDVDTGSVTPAQQEALQAWLDTGGQLVVTGGPGWRQTAAAVMDLLPVTPTDARSEADLPALSAATNTPFRDPGPYVVTTSSLKSGELLYRQDNLPLLARHSHGRGSVYFLALDPQLAPLADWDGSPILWQTIADTIPTLPYWAHEPRNAYAAAAAVESLPNLVLPSIFQLIFFLLLYVILIGPVNYMVLKRRKRLELAWVTIPALIILFSGAAYFTGFRLKGNETIVNEMSVAYGGANADTMRVHTLIGLYSPRRRAYDLTMPPATLARPFDQRGMDMNSGGNAGIERTQSLTIRNLLVDVSGVQTVIATGYAPMPAFTGTARVSIEGDSAQFSAQLQNNSDITLESASILFGGTVYAVGDLAPGESKPVSFALNGASTPSSLFSPTSSVPTRYAVPGGSVLANNYATLLGSSDYYDDRRLYPRAQLLDSLASAGYGLERPPQNTATLIGWSNTSQLEASTYPDNATQLSTTLYFIELPLREEITLEGQTTTPTALWSWEVLATNGVYEPSPDDLFIVSGWVEFEYLPWARLQMLTPDKMELLLLEANNPTSLPTPEVRLWDWGQELWVVLPDVQWGLTPVADFAPFLGENNRVRVRLRYDNPDGAQIRSVFPVLTGELR